MSVDWSNAGEDVLVGPHPEANWREIFDALRDAIVLYDATSGRILDVNQGGCALFGCDRKGLIGQPFRRLLGASGLSADDTSPDTSKTGFEVRLRRTDGSSFWAEVRLVRSRDTDHIVAMIRDIGDLRAMAEQSRLAEERYRSLVKNLPNSAIILCDHDLRLVLVDGPEISVGGFSKEEMEGRTIYEVLPSDFVKMIEPNMRRVLRGEAFSADVPFGELWYTYNYVPIFDEAGRCVVYGLILALNVTERYRVEEALKRSRERMVRVYQASPDAIGVTRASDGRLVDLNPGFERIFGWSRAEALGRTTLELNIWPDPETRRAVVREALESNFDYFERSARRKNGELVEGLLSLRATEIDGEPCLIFVFRDNTARKKAELERERAIRELTARNVEMEQFNYTVSHDLRSPLVTISGFLGMMDRDLATGDVPRARADLARIRSATHRMMGLLGDLLELSRVGRVARERESGSLNELVEEALELVAGRIADRKIRVEVAQDLPDAYGERTQLVQVLQNLIENSVKYMGDTPDPLIEIGVRPDEENVICYVRDNGIGVPPSHSERIFGLFEKLDPRSEGTGLGLALVKRIMELHGGCVWVEPGTGRGSTFVFKLPRGPKDKPARRSLET